MIGVDIVAIARIRRILARSGEAFLRKFLNKREIALCVREKGKFKNGKLKNGEFKNCEFNAQRIAGFFAAKEAIAKALSCGIGKNLAFKDIILHKDSHGAPKATLKKRAKKHFGVKKIYISIAHDASFQSLNYKNCKANDGAKMGDLGDSKLDSINKLDFGDSGLGDAKDLRILSDSKNSSPQNSIESHGYAIAIALIKF